MNKQNVEQIIKDLAMDNFSLYPENYPLTKDGTTTDEAMENIADLAKLYYETREEEEKERDNKLGIILPDYVDFCMSAFSRFLQNN